MDEIVNKMINYGKKLLGTKRYDWSHYKDETPG